MLGALARQLVVELRTDTGQRNVSCQIVLEGHGHAHNLLSMASFSGPSPNLVVELYEHETWIDCARMDEAGKRLYGSTRALLSCYRSHHVDRYSTFLRIKVPLGEAGIADAKLQAMNLLVQFMVPTLHDLLEADASKKLGLAHLDTYVARVICSPQMVQGLRL